MLSNTMIDSSRDEQETEDFPFILMDGNNCSHNQKTNDMNGKLYGCDEAEDTLTNIYHDVISSSEPILKQKLVLISGAPGTGKTDLASRTRSLVKADAGCFLSGCYQETSSGQPFPVFVSALTEYILSLSSSVSSSFRNNNSIENKKLRDRRESIQKAIDDNVESEGPMLLEVIPALKELIAENGNGKTYPSSLGSEMINSTTLQNSATCSKMKRFRCAFCKFIEDICTPDHPIVFFLDDMQYADLQSLQLLKDLISDVHKPFFVIGAIDCDDIQEANPTLHQLIQRFQRKQSVDITFLEMKNMTLDVTVDFLSDAFKLPKSSPSSSSSLSKEDDNSNIQILGNIVWNHTKGNGFCVKHFLWYLYDHNLLRYEQNHEKCSSWVWDIKQLSLHEMPDFSINCTDIVKERIICMPQLVQDVLKAAAAMGLMGLSYIDEIAIRMAVLNNDDVDADAKQIRDCLQVATKQGFLMYHSNKTHRFGRYQFSHDAVKLAAFWMVPREERKSFKWDIGRKIWNGSSGLEIKKNVFLIVALLNQGKTLIDTESERYNVISLNLTAAKEAFKRGAFIHSTAYLKHGIELLGRGCWEDQYYEITLSLFEASAEVAAANNDFEKAEASISGVFANAKSKEDKRRSTFTLLRCLGQQGNIGRAVVVGLSMLDDFGEVFSPNPTPNDIYNELWRTKGVLSGLKDDDVLNLPAMSDEKKASCLRLMGYLFPCAYSSRSPYTALFALRTVQIVIEYGQSEGDCLAFAMYGMLLCGSPQEYEQGRRFGDLAIKLCARNRETSLVWLPRVLGVINMGINHWSGPVADALSPLEKGSLIAVKFNDPWWVLMNNIFKCQAAFHSGRPLKELEVMVSETQQKAYDFEEINLLLSIIPLYQMIFNLTGRAENPTLLSGTIMNWDDALKQMVEACNMTSKCSLYLYSLQVAYLFGDYVLAHKMGEIYEEQHVQAEAAFDMSDLHACWSVYLQGLTALALLFESSTHNKKDLKRLVTRNTKKMAKWAESAPMNFLHKQQLLEAEWASFQGKRDHATSLYDKSIAGAQDHGFLQDVALSYERASYHLKRQGDPRSAEKYLSLAHQYYKEWGAIAKAEQTNVGDTSSSDMEKCRRGLLTKFNLKRSNWALGISSRKLGGDSGGGGGGRGSSFRKLTIGGTNFRKLYTGGSGDSTEMGKTHAA